MHMKNKILIFEKKSSYGHQRIYPTCPNAKLFTQLTGRKTVFPQDLAVMESLGFEIRWSVKSEV